MFFALENINYILLKRNIQTTSCQYPLLCERGNLLELHCCSNKRRSEFRFHIPSNIQRAKCGKNTPNAQTPKRPNAQNPKLRAQTINSIGRPNVYVETTIAKATRDFKVYYKMFPLIY